jgi:cytochrome oxidase Cu insertion factor (SCO1/SenC/PrrC family)
MAYSVGGRRVHLLKRLRTFAATTAAIAAGVVHTVMNPREEQVELKPGDPAPEFELVGSDGRTYRLKDLAGRPVVLSWFPKAFTGG